MQPFVKLDGQAWEANGGADGRHCSDTTSAPVVEAVESALRLVDQIGNSVDKLADAYNTAWDNTGALGHKAGTDKKEAGEHEKPRAEGHHIFAGITR